MHKSIIFYSNKIKVYFISPLKYYRKDMKVYGEWDQNKTIPVLILNQQFIMCYHVCQMQSASYLFGRHC